jgi:hypothetical protein
LDWIIAKDRNHTHTLEVRLDFVGTGVSAVDVDWLTALCRFLAEMDDDNDNNSSMVASVSVQRQVPAILEDVGF